MQGSSTTHYRSVHKCRSVRVTRLHFTSVSNTQSMIVYLRTTVTKQDNSICTYFLGLLEITDASACGLEKTLVDFFHDIGFSDELLSKQFVRFCSDGASCMIGHAA